MTKHFIVTKIVVHVFTKIIYIRQSFLIHRIYPIVDLNSIFSFLRLEYELTICKKSLPLKSWYILKTDQTLYDSL